MEESTYGECVRLSNELRSKPERVGVTPSGENFTIPATSGFDIETCNFITLKNWIMNKSIDKSEAIKAFVNRITCARFTDQYETIKQDDSFKKESSLIRNNVKNDTDWFGEVGYQNMTRLDGTLRSKNTITKKTKSGGYEVVYK